MSYSQKEKINIVLDIVKKLKNFKLINNQYIDLYDEQKFTFVKEFKLICNQYIKDTDNIKEYKGVLYFEEIDKKIEYYLPNVKGRKSLFVIRKKNNI